MSAGKYDTLDAVVEKILTADDVDAAVEDMAAVIGDQFSLRQIVLSSYRETDGVARAIALWSAVETLTEPGMELVVGLTDDMRRIANEYMRKWPFVFRTEGVDLGLLGDVFKQEGVRVWMVVPLLKDGVIEGLIGFGSGEPDAINQDDVPYFSGVARGVEARLLALIASSGRA